jgi:hypothetical protein
MVIFHLCKFAASREQGQVFFWRICTQESRRNTRGCHNSIWYFAFLTDWPLTILQHQNQDTDIQTVTMIAVLIIFLTGFAFWQICSYNRNLAVARSSGLKCVFLPGYLFSVPSWFVIRLFILPVLKRLPESWTGTWLP